MEKQQAGIAYLCPNRRTSPLRQDSVSCARDTSDLIWPYIAVNLQRSASVHMCVVFVAINTPVSQQTDQPVETALCDGQQRGGTSPYGLDGGCYEFLVSRTQVRLQFSQQPTDDDNKLYNY